MGLLETIDGLGLSDEQRAKVLEEHNKDIGEKDATIQGLSAKDKHASVEKEIDDLGALFSDPQPGLLKFVRRIFLSDDEEPGMVMLSDNDLALSGDEATGAKTREEITTAGAVRKFIELLPRNAEGKLELSDQGIAADDTNRPDKTDDEKESPEEEAKARRARVESLGIKLRKRDGQGGDA